MRVETRTENLLEISYQPSNKNYDFILPIVANLCLRRTYFKANETLCKLKEELFKGNLETNTEEGIEELRKIFFSYDGFKNGCFYLYSKLLGINITLPTIEACIEADRREKKLSFILKESDIDPKLHQITYNEDRNDFSVTYSCFVSFYEKYKEKLEEKYSTKYFYDIGTREFNNEIWSLAKILRDSISHSEILGTPHPFDYLINILKENVDLHLFEKKIDLSNWVGKSVNQVVNSIDLIILMIAMEEELERENIIL